MTENIMELGGLIFSHTEPGDLKRIMEIEAENSRFVFTWSLDRHLQAIEREDEAHISVKASGSGELVGYIILAGIGSCDNVIEFRRIAVLHKGRGYGRTAVRFIKRHSFECLKCHRLWLDVYTDNENAIALYRSEGFVEEGILRECRKSGDDYRSMLVMSILENEYNGQ